jgi:HAD superfamily hydrolase (TIGR01484 family)
MSHYQQELEQLAQTYRAALTAPESSITRLKAAIQGASESSVIGVGSGGSFTVASLLCNLHETFTGRVSRPSTPLEVICNPTLASASPVFLISAEGKNPDITEALQRARRHSARPIHVLTNRVSSPLMNRAITLNDVTTHVFELTQKDGYLATNSLLMDAVLIARAYDELDHGRTKLPQDLSELRVGEVSIGEWVTQAQSFVESAVARGTITVIYSPQLRPVAADLESKLSEGALLHVQLADLRSYAHGRHLWLSSRPNDCAVLALTEPSLSGLWRYMRALFPTEVPTLTMALPGSDPSSLIAGLVAQMRLVSMIASLQGKDPGRPTVPQFGRDLYYIDLQSVIPAPQDEPGGSCNSKYDVLGAKWPSPRRQGPVQRALEDSLERFASQCFRAILFDYDGTLCSSQRIEHPPQQDILDQIARLVNAGVVVGIASGRGGSIQEQLAQSLPADVLSKIHLGLYNGGWLANASQQVGGSGESSEFLSHVTRIVHRLKRTGVPIDRVKTTPPFQVSVRFHEGISTESMWFVIADALRQDGLDSASIVRSKHSVDILAPGNGKSRLVAQVIRELGIDPYQILTVGDQGAWPGNDSALLEHRYSLSVDVPSRRLDRGWKLAPAHKRDVDATLWYLQRIALEGNGCFRLDLSRTD